MTTKEQERKALEQIKKILETLGADSYVGAAIDAEVLQAAEDNIGNDWMLSPSERIRNLEKSEQETRAKLDAMTDSRDAWKEKAEKQEARAAELMESLKSVKEMELDTLRERDEADRELEKAKNEIIILKAKLYDLITK